MSKNNFLSVASNMMLMYGKCKACVQVQFCPNSLPCAHARYYEGGATKQLFEIFSPLHLFLVEQL